MGELCERKRKMFIFAVRFSLALFISEDSSVFFLKVTGGEDPHLNILLLTQCLLANFNRVLLLHHLITCDLNCFT